jgi:tetratricopeptide (TPR) repeat protein
LACWLGLAASYGARADAASERAREEAGGLQTRSLLDQVEANAKTAVALNPLDAQTWLLLGGIYRSTGRSQEAVEAYRVAARRAPTWSIPWHRLGETLSASGDRAGAVAAYREALARDPNATPSLLALARVLEADGQPDAARRTYERLVAVSRSPAGTVRALEQMRDYRPAEAHAILGDAAVKAGKLDEAISHFRPAARQLQARRRELTAGGFETAILAGKSSALEEERLLALERSIWPRLTDLYRRTGDLENARWASDQAAAAARAVPPGQSTP